MRVTVLKSHDTALYHDPNMQGTVEIQVGGLIVHVEEREGELCVRRVPGPERGISLAVRPVSGNVIHVVGGR